MLGSHHNLCVDMLFCIAGAALYFVMLIGVSTQNADSELVGQASDVHGLSPALTQRMLQEMQLVNEKYNTHVRLYQWTPDQVVMQGLEDLPDQVQSDFYQIIHKYEGMTEASTRMKGPEGAKGSPGPAGPPGGSLISRYSMASSPRIAQEEGKPLGNAARTAREELEDEEDDEDDVNENAEDDQNSGRSSDSMVQEENEDDDEDEAEEQKVGTHENEEDDDDEEDEDDPESGHENAPLSSDSMVQEESEDENEDEDEEDHEDTDDEDDQDEADLSQHSGSMTQEDEQDEDDEDAAKSSQNSASEDKEDEDDEDAAASSLNSSSEVQRGHKIKEYRSSEEHRRRGVSDIIMPTPPVEEAVTSETVTTTGKYPLGYIGPGGGAIEPKYHDKYAVKPDIAQRKMKKRWEFDHPIAWHADVFDSKPGRCEGRRRKSRRRNVCQMAHRRRRDHRRRRRHHRRRAHEYRRRRRRVHRRRRVTKDRNHRRRAHRRRLDRGDLNAVKGLMKRNKKRGKGGDEDHDDASKRRGGRAQGEESLLQEVTEATFPSSMDGDSAPGSSIHPGENLTQSVSVTAFAKTHPDFGMMRRHNQAN